jgi:hypothetical protein
MTEKTKAHLRWPQASTGFGQTKGFLHSHEVTKNPGSDQHCLNRIDTDDTWQKLTRPYCIIKPLLIHMKIPGISEDIKGTVSQDFKYKIS